MYDASIILIINKYTCKDKSTLYDIYALKLYCLRFYKIYEQIAKSYSIFIFDFILITMPVIFTAKKQNGI